MRRSITVLNLDDGIVDLYGSTRAALERRGIVKSDFDLLIQCTALRQDAVKVTNDQGLLDVEIPVDRDRWSYRAASLSAQ